MVTSATRRSIWGSMSEAAEVPSCFMCPISLEMMSDPVTLSTGHTYDRSSIRRWFQSGKNTCPQTRLEVHTKDLLPNLTLKNCIRSWLSDQNTSFIAPKKDSKFSSLRPLTAEGVRLMLESLTLENLETMRILARSSPRNRKLICDGGAVPLLGSILSRGSGSCSRSLSSCSLYAGDCEERYFESPLLLREEALGALIDLSVTGETKRNLLPDVGLSNLPALSFFLRKGSSEAKHHAVRIVEFLIEDDESLLQLGTADGLIAGLVGLIREHPALPKAVRPSLRSLHAICLPKKNRSMAVEAGAVAAVIEILPGATKEIADGALAVLDLMSRCSEGRSALHRHALFVPVMVRSIAAYSSSATEHAIKLLHSWFVNNVVDQLVYDEAIRNGLIAKLLLINQIPQTNSDMHQKTRELLKNLLANCSSSDPCVATITYSK